MSRFKAPSNVLTWLLVLAALAVLTPKQVQSGIPALSKSIGQLLEALVRESPAP